VAATAIGYLLNFIGLNPIKALYWTAILNGVLAAPLMAAMLFIASNKKIMGEQTLPPALKATGWLAMAVMAAAALAFFVL
jgi:Mn2+/Fe2+ NRAMP family transporter